MIKHGFLASPPPAACGGDTLLRAPGAPPAPLMARTVSIVLETCTDKAPFPEHCHDAQRMPTHTRVRTSAWQLRCVDLKPASQKRTLTFTLGYTGVPPEAKPPTVIKVSNL